MDKQDGQDEKRNLATQRSQMRRGFRAVSSLLSIHPEVTENPAGAVHGYAQPFPSTDQRPRVTRPTGLPVGIVTTF